MIRLQWLYLNKTNMDTYPPLPPNHHHHHHHHHRRRRRRRRHHRHHRHRRRQRHHNIIFISIIKTYQNDDNDKHKHPNIKQHHHHSWSGLFSSPRSKASNSQSGFGCEVFLVADLWVQYLSRSTNNNNQTISINFNQSFFLVQIKKQTAHWMYQEQCRFLVNFALTHSFYLQILQPFKVHLSNRLVLKVLMDMTWAISRTKVKTPPDVA